MARRRFQRGSLLPTKGLPKDNIWRGRWREDVIVNGIVTRKLKWEIIGTTTEYPTRRLAERELTNRLSGVNSPSYRPTHSATFKEFSEKWKRDFLSQFKQSVQASENSRLRKHLVPFFGNSELREISAGRVQEFIAQAKVGPKTVKNCIATMRLVWNVAVRDRYIGKDCDWFEGVRLPEIMPVEQQHFTEEEIARIIWSANEPYRTFYWILGETGIRLGEGCALKVNAIDLVDRKITIRYSAWQGKFGTTKSKKPRVFPISRPLAEHLRQFVELKKDNPDAFLFSTKNNTPWNGSDLVKDHLRPLLLELGIKTERAGTDAEGQPMYQVMEGVGAHAFRHGNLSIMDRENIPAKVRQERAGHSNFERLTLGIYTHTVSADHREAAEKLGAKFAPVN